MYGQPEQPATQGPCANVQAEILNGKDEVLAQTLTNQEGQFRFVVPAGKKYFIRVIDRRKRQAKVAQPIGAGQHVLLILQP